MTDTRHVIVDDLLSRRLVILSGKGGVGKSVVGTALALLARDQGKKVLLIEVNSTLSAARFLGAPPAGGQEIEVRPGFFMVNLDPTEVMREYVRKAVRVDLIARKVLESPIYSRFFAAAPGLPELMVLGKIMVFEEARQGWTKKPVYDLVIVDAPATGHGLAFLKVPQAASRAVPVGPVGNNARRILSMLQDDSRTALVIVAIPEEMAVVEALELRQLARDELGIEARAVILNACHERRFSAHEEAEILSLRWKGTDARLAPGVGLAAALAAARRHIRRRKLTDFYKKKLRRAQPFPLVTLPFLPEETISAAAVRILAERLTAV